MSDNDHHEEKHFKDASGADVTETKDSSSSADSTTEKTEVNVESGNLDSDADLG